MFQRIAPFVVVGGLVASVASAADVRSNATMLNQYLGSDQTNLSTEDRAALDLAKRWQAKGGSGGNVSVGPNGMIRFNYGGGQPVVVCAVLQVCDVELQPGEVVTSLNAGDTVRWQIDPSFSGAPGGAETSHIIVKPTDAGLDTSLVIGTTRRTYHIRLRSHATDFMPRVGFVYPEDAMARFETERRKREQERVANTIPETGEYLGNLDFNYRLSGSAPWVPLRVFNDGKKTIIQMPDTMGQTEAPVLLVVRKDGGLWSDDETVLVNYRLLGDRYIVDAIFDKAVLIAGVGSGQDRVTIERRAKK